MTIHRCLAITASVLAVTVGLLGCAAQPPPGVAQDQVLIEDAVAEVNPPTEPSSDSEASSSVDPNWPWPEKLPRPQWPIINEFSGENLLGEGGVHTIQFTVPSAAAAQEYGDALAAAGVEWMLEGIFPEPEDGESEISLVSMAEGYMATLTVDVDSGLTDFTFLGVME